MEFCDKCGGMISIKEGKPVCLACGYRPRKKVKIEASEKMEKKNEVAIINEEDSNTFPVVQINCPKCDSKKAYFWTTQTRAADESETKFYKCVKCKHTWRVYR